MNGQTFLQMYWDIPIITRCYATSCVLTTLAVQLGFVSPYQLYFNPKLIFHNYQVWRLVTAFLFFGEIDFTFLLNLAFTYRYSSMLEMVSFHDRPADYLYLFILGATSLVIIALFVNLLFLGHALTIMLVYIWARRNPSVRLDFLGIANFHAPFLPFVLLLLGLLINSDTLVDIMGIVVGHIYFYFEDVLPNITENNVRILKTPAFLRNLFEQQPDINEPIPARPREPQPEPVHDHDD